MNMQTFYSFIICPECQTQNTPWRRFCKQCRGPLDGALRRNSTITTKIYRTFDPKVMLAISPQYIALHTPSISLQSSWENIQSLVVKQTAALVLKESAIFPPSERRQIPPPREGLIIPLSQFGYPENRALVDDLRTYLPERLRNKLG